MVCYSHLFKNCPQFVVTIGFGIVNIAEVDVFLELSSIPDKQDHSLSVGIAASWPPLCP